MKNQSEEIKKILVSRLHSVNSLPSDFEISDYENSQYVDSDSEWKFK